MQQKKHLFYGLEEYTIDSKGRLVIFPDYREVISCRNSVNLKKMRENGSLEKSLDFLEVKDANDSELLRFLNRQVYFEKGANDKELKGFAALDYALMESKEFESYLKCEMDAQHRITLPKMDLVFPELLAFKENLKRRRYVKNIVEEHRSGIVVYGRKDYFALRPSLLVYFEKKQ